jgi:hypothetical protein
LPVLSRFQTKQRNHEGGPTVVTMLNNAKAY